MKPASSDSFGRRLTLADFPPAEVESVLGSSGQTLAAVQQLESEYLAAEKRGDDTARKRLNAKLQPIYQKLASLPGWKPSAAAEDSREQ